MLNLNNVPQDTNTQSRDMELIPDNVVAHGVIKLLGGDTQLPEFGNGMYFKSSQSTSAKWLPLEITIIGGPYDKRKIWQNIFVDGDKMGQNGIPLAKEIGLRMLKSIVDSAFGLDPTDQSPQAQQTRNLQGVHQLDNMTFCFKVGIEPGNNGYADKNKVKTILTVKSKEYIPYNSAPVQAQPMAQPVAQTAAPIATATNGVVPSWAQ